MIGIMDLTRSYHWSKGSLVTIVEDGALGNLAAAGDREETASHHLARHVFLAPGDSYRSDGWIMRTTRAKTPLAIYLGHSLLHRESGAKHSPPGAS